MDVTKPYEFIGFAAMDVTKPYEFIGFGAWAWKTMKTTWLFIPCMACIGSPPAPERASMGSLAFGGFLTKTPWSFKVAALTRYR